ncbi:MAG: hypothetical protein DHS20C12_00810 [Pseudohongiella sp.]|nr:MAG: hypothetical protein DHS20C12_00810 [Pseudohongiella sp.]
MRSSRDFQEAQSGATGNEDGGLLAALLTTAPSLLSRYQDQLVAVGKVLRLELRLTLRCAAFILASMLILGCVILSAWVGLNVALAYALLAIDAPVLSIVLAVVSFHVLALTGLVSSIRTLIDEIGFDKSISALGVAAGESADGDSKI